MTACIRILFCMISLCEVDSSWWIPQVKEHSFCCRASIISLLLTSISSYPVSRFTGDFGMLWRPWDDTVMNLASRDRKRSVVTAKLATVAPEVSNDRASSFPHKTECYRGILLYNPIRMTSHGCIHVSNHRQIDCLFKCLFMITSVSIKPHLTGPLWGESTR